MSELSKRRQRLIVEIQRSERRKYLAQMRAQLLAKWREAKEKSKNQHILYAAFVAYDEENGPCLDIYVNIQQLLDEILRKDQKFCLAYLLSLYLYCNLTSSDEVITYMIQTNPIRQWNKMKSIIKKYSKYEETLYERMRVFLQITCAKYKIQRFHIQQFNEDEYELKNIFNEQFTNELIASLLGLDGESQYYGFMDAYISFMPLSHLLPFFISGFAYQTLQCINPNLALSFLGRVDSARSICTQMEEIYQQFYQRLLDRYDEE